MNDSAAVWEPGDSGIKPVKDAGRSQYREYWRARGRRSGADHPDSSGTRGLGINHLVAARDVDGSERLAVVVIHEPPPRPVSKEALLPGAGRRAELDLDVDARRLGAGQKLLLQRLPEGRVVDVAGQVALGGAKAPAACFACRARRRMAQPGAHPALGRR